MAEEKEVEVEEKGLVEVVEEKGTRACDGANRSPQLPHEEEETGVTRTRGREPLRVAAAASSAMRTARRAAVIIFNHT